MLTEGLSNINLCSVHLFVHAIIVPLNDAKFATDEQPRQDYDEEGTQELSGCRTDQVGSFKEKEGIRLQSLDRIAPALAQAIPTLRLISIADYSSDFEPKSSVNTDSAPIDDPRRLWAAYRLEQEPPWERGLYRKDMGTWKRWEIRREGDRQELLAIYAKQAFEGELRLLFDSI